MSSSYQNHRPKGDRSERGADPGATVEKVRGQGRSRHGSGVGDREGDRHQARHRGGGGRLSRHNREGARRDPRCAPVPSGAEVLGAQCDVSDEASVDRAVKQAAALGRIEVLANVAGIGGFHNAHDVPVAAWQKMIGVNLTGTFLVTRASLPALLDGGGAIVNVASTAGLIGSAYSAAYCASKGGVVMLTKALAVEYADKGVRVNAVAPGGVQTPLLGVFANSLPEGADPKHLYRIISRMGYCEPEDVAAAIAFLASDESYYTTGAILSIDGGITA